MRKPGETASRAQACPEREGPVCNSAEQGHGQQGLSPKEAHDQLQQTLGFRKDEAWLSD